MVGDSASAMRNDETQFWKILEQFRRDELHESGRVSIDVVRSCCMEVRVAACADMNHGGHVELDHFLVKRIPMLVCQGRRSPMTARRVRIQIAANEAQLLD